MVGGVEGGIIGVEEEEKEGVYDLLKSRTDPE